MQLYNEKPNRSKVMNEQSTNNITRILELSVEILEMVRSLKKRRSTYEGEPLLDFSEVRWIKSSILYFIVNKFVMIIYVCKTQLIRNKIELFCWFNKIYLDLCFIAFIYLYFLLSCPMSCLLLHRSKGDWNFAAKRETECSLKHCCKDTSYFQNISIFADI